MNLHNILNIKYDQCPPECNACREACASERNDGVEVIKSLHIPEIGFDSAVTCFQCGIAMCVDICTTGAISKDEEDGVVKINEEKCVGCGLCTVACPYGGIFYHTSEKKAVKCDLCEGDPKCVSACEYGVLTFQKIQDVVQYLGEDRASHGNTLCQGCGAEHLIRFSLRVMGEKTIVCGGPGCGAIVFAGTEGGVFWPGSSFITFMTNMPSTLSGVKRYYDRIGEDVTCVAIAGDGLTADVGFQPLSGAAER